MNCFNEKNSAKEKYKKIRRKKILNLNEKKNGD